MFEKAWITMLPRREAAFLFVHPQGMSAGFVSKKVKPIAGLHLGVRGLII